MGTENQVISKADPEGGVYICLRATMATGLSAIQGQGKVLIVCSILLIYLSMYSI